MAEPLEVQLSTVTMLTIPRPSTPDGSVPSRIKIGDQIFRLEEVDEDWCHYENEI